jgi:hypothetical protein
MSASKFSVRLFQTPFSAILKWWRGCCEWMDGQWVFV